MGAMGAARVYEWLPPPPGVLAPLAVIGLRMGGWVHLLSGRPCHHHHCCMAWAVEVAGPEFPLPCFGEGRS